ncbi:hypothetical protein SmJEL517_g03927 [Synchytrium microbalum]|uniref:CDP-diacylglycerol--inositol 3-phosphatidyltransferase n=1 Tax=Synchytrium microbalum TaxID=1806994 RepID=A0A507C209_9FUNG|nr:uncharacterized protein SmJEL517_g03927 [Synchytrium microbalum]TPX33089.1 hypothetical protein SmJEL517_g03927 [Synchytrium microbalum]
MQQPLPPFHTILSSDTNNTTTYQHIFTIFTTTVTRLQRLGLIPPSNLQIQLMHLSNGSVWWTVLPLCSAGVEMVRELKWCKREFGSEDVDLDMGGGGGVNGWMRHGYIRVALALWSFYLLPSSPWGAMGLYGLSCILDAADGSAARQLNQATKFGAVLDMVTDRCTTACLMLTLSHLLPSYTLIFQILLSLDISSHYMHMYATMMSGAISHKQIPKNANPLLRLYYSNAIVLFLVCAGNELFFMSSYILAPHQDVSNWGKMDVWLTWFVVGVWWTCLPVFGFKQVTNVVQLVNASRVLAEADGAARSKGKERARQS